MRIFNAFFVSKLKLKLYPSVEKVFIVDELDIIDVLLLLLLRILWFRRWKRLVRLLLNLPEGAGRPIQSEEGVVEGGVGAGGGGGAD